VWKDKKGELRSLKKAKSVPAPAEKSSDSHKDRKLRREGERLAFKSRKSSMVEELKALKNQWKEMKALWKKTKKEYKKQTKSAKKSSKKEDKHKVERSDLPFDRRAARAARLGKPVRQANFIEELTSVYNEASGTYEAVVGREKCAPGAIVRKVWRIRNDGDQPWAAGSRLVAVGGRGGAELKLHDDNIVIPAAQPGEVIEVTLILNAPLEPGCYHTIWRMCLQGEKWGPRLWTKVTVIGEPTTGILPASFTDVKKPHHVMRQALVALVAQGHGDLHQNRRVLRANNFQVDAAVRALNAIKANANAA